MKKKIFLGKEPDVEEPPRGGIRLVTKSREPDADRPPRRGGIRFFSRTSEPKTEERSGGLRFIPRSKSGATTADISSSTRPQKASPYRQQTTSHRRSSDNSGSDSARVAITVVAALIVVLVVAAIYAAGKPRPLPPVPAARFSGPSEPSSPPERMWIKEAMKEIGPSEELQARRARMGQFQHTGTATGTRQN